MESLNLIKNHFADMDYLRSYTEVLLRTRTRGSTSYAVNLEETTYTTANTSTGYTNYLNDLTGYYNIDYDNLKDDSFHWEIDYVLAGFVYSDWSYVVSDLSVYLDTKLMILCQPGKLMSYIINFVINFETANITDTTCGTNSRFHLLLLHASYTAEAATCAT